MSIQQADVATLTLVVSGDPPQVSKPPKPVQVPTLITWKIADTEPANHIFDHHSIYFPNPNGNFVNLNVPCPREVTMLDLCLNGGTYGYSVKYAGQKKGVDPSIDNDPKSGSGS